jgi:hypothetical protein
MAYREIVYDPSVYPTHPERRQAADQVFAEHDFGDDTVKDTGCWQQDGDEWSIPVYLEREGDSERILFVVRFEPGSAKVNEAGAGGSDPDVRPVPQPARGPPTAGRARLGHRPSSGAGIGSSEPGSSCQPSVAELESLVKLAGRKAEFGNHLLTRQRDLTRVSIKS